MTFSLIRGNWIFKRLSLLTAGIQCQNLASWKRGSSVLRCKTRGRGCYCWSSCFVEI